MGNTASTTSRKHQKRTSPRKVKQNKKSPAGTNSTMRGIRAKMASTSNKKAPRKNTRKSAKTNDTSSMIKKYGPVAWSKAKASGVGPFKNKNAPPPRKASIFKKLASSNKKRR